MNGDRWRAAARKIGATAGDAYPGRWTETDESRRYGGIVAPAQPSDPHYCDGYGGALVAESVTGANRAQLMLWSPPPARAAAKLLNDLADALEGGGLDDAPLVVLAVGALVDEVLGDQQEVPF